VWSLIEKSWVQIKIAFDVRDGTKKTGKTFELPEDMNTLSPDRKQLLTLCNLFANHDQSIEELAVYSGMDRSQVISVLLQEGLLVDQRRRTHEPVRGGRRDLDRTGSSAASTNASQDGLTFSKSTRDH
jgi:predicted transcriptional regulator